MKESIEELERKYGMFSHHIKDLPKTMHEKDFKEVVARELPHFQGVDYKQRVAFLNKNGYEVTRNNLMDANLPSKQK